MSQMPPPTPEQLASLEYQKAHITDNQQPRLRATNIAMGVVATVAVALRLYSRRLVKVKLQSDDYCIIVALLLTWGTVGLTFELIDRGLGKHAILVDPSTLVTYLKVLYTYDLVYICILPIIKISILLFYHRIFTPRYFQRILYGVELFMVLWVVSGFIVGIFQCVPVHKFWNLEAPGYCINKPRYYMIEGIINIFTDFVILLLPMPLVWKLHITKKQKIALVGVFLLGGFTCVASIIRVPTLEEVEFFDSTWTSANTLVWTIIEVGLAIVCACLPVMRPLFRTLLANPFTGISGASKNSRRYQGGSIPQSGKVSWPGTKKEGMISTDTSNGDFQRLNDSATDSQKTWSDYPSSRNKPSVMSAVGRGTERKDETEVESQDVPLNAIGVKRDVEWTSADRA
ncbi:MAG: hypothetical protein M1817_001286 [Caeruleum heppii]|nr:MAG: hypothetical protein M1817_001286 [Caeruleum heppii]